MHRPSWDEGYTVDVDYVREYFGDWIPDRVRFALLSNGWQAPALHTACELGYGQGVTLAIGAAAGSTTWTGTDFNPSHAVFARALVDGEARVYDDSFAEFAARDDLPMFDMIVLHGIWSWVSEANRQVIVDFLKRRLAVGGVVYISYNVPYGWTSVAAVRHLMKHHYETRSDRSAGLEARVRSTIAFAESLVATRAGHLAAQPQAADRIARLKTLDWRYVLHEYLNEDWHPDYFADVARTLSAGAKLGWACPAHFHDQVDILSLTTDQMRLVGEVNDPIARETMRDFFCNRNFRRDLFLRGGSRIAGRRQREALSGFTLMLLTRRQDVSATIGAAGHSAQLQPAIYDPILDRLAAGPVGVGELIARHEANGISLGQTIEAIRVLLGRYEVGFVQEEATIAARRPATDALNRRLLDFAGEDLRFLASPVIGAGVPVDSIHQLFIAARLAGRTKVAELADHALASLAAGGRSLVDDGKPITDPLVAREKMVKIVEGFLENRLPLLERLQVI
jgi:SAM-dependent methyltransferase